MIRLHYGRPHHPGSLRFFRGTLSSKSSKQRIYLENQIRWLFGVSWKASCFIGIVRTERTREEHVSE